MKELIKIDTEDVISDEMNNLIFDEKIIKENPNIQFTDEEASAYHNFIRRFQQKRRLIKVFMLNKFKRNGKIVG